MARNGMDLSTADPEAARRFVKAMEESLANMRPINARDILDLREAKAAWDRGERGYGLAARLMDATKEEG